MKKILLAAFLSVGMLSCDAQGQTEVKVSKGVTVVTYKLPPQTEISASGEKLVKVKSSNDDVIRLINKYYNRNLQKFSKAIKKDRYGTYQEYTMYFPKEYAISIIETLNTLIKQ